MSSDTLLNKLNSALAATQAKQAAVAAEAEEKAVKLNPEWREVPADQFRDLDADTAQITGEELSRRLVGESPGKSPDAYETSAEAYVDEPGEYSRAAARTQQAKAYAASRGITDWKDVTDEQLVQAGKAQERKKAEFFGDQPRQIKDVGVDKYGRILTRERNAEGEEWGDQFSGPQENANFLSDYNAKDQLKWLLSPEGIEHVYGNRQRSVGEAASDLGKQALISTAEMGAQTVAEGAAIADKLANPLSWVRMAMGKEPLGAMALDRLGISEGITDLADAARKSTLSVPEQKNQAAFERRIQEREANRPYVIEGYLKEGYSQNVAEALATKDEMVGVMADLWQNPDRLLNGMAESAGSFIGVAALGRTVFKKGVKALAKKAGKTEEEILKDPASIKKLEKMSIAAGITGGSAMEAGMASAEIRQSVLDKNPEDLYETSALFKKYVDEDKLSLADAHAKLADRAATIGYGAMFALAGTTAVVTGAGAFNSKVFYKGLEKDFLDAGLPLNLLKGAGKVALDAGKEGAEEIVQSGGEVVIGNTITKTHVDEFQDLWEGIGTAAGIGAATGAGMGGGMSTVSTGVKQGVRLAKEGTYKNPEEAPHFRADDVQAPAEIPADQRGPVTYVGNASAEKLNPTLRGIVENTTFPVQINSGHRDGDTGHHGKGDAVDIQISKFSDEEKKELVKQLYRNGATRFITYDDSGHLHVDIARTHGRFHPMHTPAEAGKKSGSHEYMDRAPEWFKQVTEEIQQGTIPDASNQVGQTIDAFQGVPETPVAKRINEGILAAAEKHGLPPTAVAYLKSIAQIESRWGANTVGQQIGSEVSGDMAHAGDRAMGPFQFMTKTANAYGLKDRNDPMASADAAARHMLDAYKVQKRKNPNLSEEELWYRAAIGHHSGPNFKKLGKWGRDYADKLKSTVGTYLGTTNTSASVTRGTTSTISEEAVNKAQTVEDVVGNINTQGEQYNPREAFDAILSKDKDDITSDDLVAAEEHLHRDGIPQLVLAEQLEKEGKVDEADSISSRAY